MKDFRISLPLSSAEISYLHPNDKVLLSGTVYTARDEAHKRMIAMLKEGVQLPFELSETAIFYCGPSPAAAGMICGAIGPTTSSRMDPFTPELLKAGLRVMIGKGERSPETEQEIKAAGALYLIAIGGISAVLSQSIVSCETFLWESLGAEAVFKMELKDFPCYVGIV
ncbi:MAG: FumA C-terminus/TtdB family hydratase beta subunit [Candidatus Cloacimonetes bacterium]|jgi:fumarate hydratase subunit beta|nr:FumA C-terminus/TtdB family hydratase beta subunit [Candidatus Cloacimonadota bacterium]MCB5287851.1 FumA C-terminus/TtdB family hydratase beta subunit [Candidatus Cloacimonadota bacterium]MCK9184944.1 FumA C-terminus/TtdB family hydratase beta subunit [Candidatus Cloacimonadota bacterium]MCK9585137.1 FumA C-terminus/TtdB family hydratase beta subunit [Candidatus Cloacimonadota bacterium]MDY0230171.1 FumA C-terminus/TtdB family hydratase beta subunit [Candidatus Cloacimonadaceae bacterium]